MITLLRTNLSIFVLRKQSKASSGLQTTGSFSTIPQQLPPSPKGRTGGTIPAA
jgi:hypothetical protein